MSNYRFGDDYKLSYYLPDAPDCMGGVDWEFGGMCAECYWGEGEGNDER